MAKGRKPGDGRGRLGGRVAGTPNKATKIGKDAILQLIAKNWVLFEENLEAIESPKDYCMVIMKLMEYVFPKMSSVEVKGDIEAPDWMAKLESLKKK